jgi:hypothetical protein
MGLSCECDFDESPSIFRCKIVIARKPHKCYECGEVISIGTEYEYIFGVWNGDASSFHTCERCADLRDSLEALGFCVAYGDVQYDYREYLKEYKPPKLENNKNE